MRLNNMQKKTVSQNSAEEYAITWREVRYIGLKPAIKQFNLVDLFLWYIQYATYFVLYDQIFPRFRMNMVVGFVRNFTIQHKKLTFHFSNSFFLLLFLCINNQNFYLTQGLILRTTSHLWNFIQHSIYLRNDFFKPFEFYLKNFPNNK